MNLASVRLPGHLAEGAVPRDPIFIRDKNKNLLEPVLRLAVEEIQNAKLDRPFIQVAGICGPTDQANAEAELAREAP